MEVWEVCARAEIRAHVDANFFLYDADRYVEAYAMFTEDCTYVPHPPMRPLQGRAQILERFTLRPDGRLGDYEWVLHNTATHWVEAITPEAAETFTYYVVLCDGVLSTAGKMHDEWVFRDGRWWIQTRRVLQDLTVIGPPPELVDFAPGTSS